MTNKLRWLCRRAHTHREPVPRSLSCVSSEDLVPSWTHEFMGICDSGERRSREARSHTDIFSYAGYQRDILR